MKKSTWKTYAFWIVFTEAVGALSGWLTREGTKIYNTAIQQLIGMQQRGEQVVDGQTVEHGVGVGALVLALPDHDNTGQFGMLFLGGEQLAAVGLHATGQLSQIVGDTDCNQADCIVILDGREAFAQLVNDDQVVHLGEGGISCGKAGQLDDGITGIQQTGGCIGGIPGQCCALDGRYT